MSLLVVDSLEDVQENIARFNTGLAVFEPNAGEDLADVLDQFRGWFFDPESDTVGPVGFVGFVGMDARSYMASANRDMDGRVTARALRRWFEPLPEGSPERLYVRRAVQDLLSGYGQAPDEKVRYFAPRDWTVPKLEEAPDPEEITDETETESPAPSGEFVEIFWRAFLTMPPGEQEDLSARISNFLSSLKQSA